MSLTARLRRLNIYYGWYIVLAGLVSNFIVFGTTLFSLSVYIEPMASELGWSVAAISGAVSIRTFEQGLMSPLAGFAADRFGPRKMALFGVFLLVVGLAMYSQVRSFWVFYLSALIIAMGQSFGPPTAFSLAAMRWFTRLRGRATGLIVAGNGMGSLAIPVLVVLVAAVGWRESLLILAAFILVTLLPLAMVLRSYPQEYGYLPDGDRAPAQSSDAGGLNAPGPEAGLSIAQAVRRPAFYFLGIANTAAISTQIAWIVHQVPHLKNAGFSMGGIGFVAAMYGVTQILARVIAGWAGDYIGQRNIYIASFILQGAGLLIVANLGPGQPWMLPLFFLTMPVGHSALVVSSNTTIADYFGTKRYASIRGLMATFSLPLGIAAPIVAGWMFDETGTYRLIFMVYGGLAASGVLWALLAGRPGGRPTRAALKAA